VVTSGGRFDEGVTLPEVEVPEGRVILTGEPTLRADLPSLLSCGAMATDGLALPAALPGLRRAGLRRVRIGFHAARPEAHDWVAGRRGCARRVVKAMRMSLASGLSVEAEVLLTRPTAPLLADTVQALHALGVPRVLVRRHPRVNVATAARWGQVDFERVVRLGPDVTLHGFPSCVVGSAAAWVVPSSAEPEVGPLAGTPRHATGCEGCTCEGPDADYTALFGRTELPDGVRAPQLALAGPTRGLRQQLVRLAQQHRSLKVTVDLGRDAASDLLRDCKRLFEHVDVTATGSMEGWTKRQRDAVRGLDIKSS
jgi:hypothetical protein